MNHLKLKVKLNFISKALEANQFKTANEIHLSLMMDYPAEVSQWMVGIKRLIHELTTLQGTEETEKPASGIISQPITCPLQATNDTINTETNAQEAQAINNISSVQDI